MSTQFSLRHQIVAEFRQFAHSQQPIIFLLSPLEAWSVLTAIQLAQRHPGNQGPTLRLASRVGRRLQSQVALTPALRLVMDWGWDPKFDGE